MRARPFALALVAMCGQGCGLLVQTTFGWNSERTETQGKAHRVRISSSVEGATVLRATREGAPTSIGIVPVEDEVSYDEILTIREPRAAWVLIAGGLEVLGGAVFGGVVGSASGETGAGLATGVPLLTAGVVDLLVGFIHLAGGEEIIRRESVDRDVQYLGQVGSALTSGVVRVPVEDRLELVFAGQPDRPVLTTAAPKPAEPALLRPGGTDRRIVAVMEVLDNNAGDPERAIGPDLVASLTDQMRVFIAERGLRVVDRGAQEAALREEIMALKQDSYQQCYDESCQIELGKALAASHILRAHIARFGTLCTLNAELIDLEKEVTSAAASAKGPCRAEGFLDMAEAVARRIAP